MTVEEIRSIIRERVVTEQDTNFFADAALDNIIIAASEEVAAAFKFPQGIASGELPVGSVNFELPKDMLSIELGQIYVGGYRVAPKDYITIQEKRRLPAGATEVYNYDPRRGGILLLAPKTPEATNIFFEYTKRVYTDANGVYRKPSPGSQIWGTAFVNPNWTVPLFPNFHHVITYLAGSIAFDMSQEYEKGDHYYQRFGEKARAFAHFIGQSDALDYLLDRQFKDALTPKGT